MRGKKDEEKGEEKDEKDRRLYKTFAFINNRDLNIAINGTRSYKCRYSCEKTMVADGLEAIDLHVSVCEGLTKEEVNELIERLVRAPGNVAAEFFDPRENKERTEMFYRASFRPTFVSTEEEVRYYVAFDLIGAYLANSI